MKNLEEKTYRTKFNKFELNPEKLGEIIGGIFLCP